jgi:hypothetical protein
MKGLDLMLIVLMCLVVFVVCNRADREDKEIRAGVFIECFKAGNSVAECDRLIERRMK